MPAITLEMVDDFSIGRIDNTINPRGDFFGGVGGGGATVAPCPSGYGWALTKDTSIPNNHSTQWTPPSTHNTVGFAAFLTMGLPVTDAAFRGVIRAFTTSTNRAIRLVYRRSTNEYRLEYNNGVSFVAITGSTFAGPTNPAAVHHVAFEVNRSAATGTAKAWLDGALVVNLTNVNTGDGSHLFNRYEFSAPTASPLGAGQTSIGNVMAWNTTAHSWDGRVKVVQRLAPTADVFVSNWSTPGPYWSQFADPTVTSQTVTHPSEVRVALSDLTMEPDFVYGLYVYWRHSTIATGRRTLREPGFSHVGPNIAGQANLRDYIGGPNAGGDWTATQLNNLELSIEGVSGDFRPMWAHLLVVRSLPESPIIVPPALGRAIIMSSRPRWVI